MSEGLKKGWTKVAFGDVVDHIAERVEPTINDSEKYIGLEHLDSDSLTIRRWGTDVPLAGTKLRMRKGDILFAKRNAYLRRVAIAPHDGLFSAHGMVLRAKPEVVMPEFLPFFMQSDLFMERAKQISVGSLSPTINWKTLAKEEFALPPMEEQRRIAKVLSTANRLNDCISRLEQACFSFLSSYSANLFERYVSEDKLMVQFGDICSKKPQSGIYKSEAYRGKGVPMVNMGELFAHDLINNNIDMDKVVVDEKELSRYKLTSNDLLFGRRSVVLEGAGKCVMVGDLLTPTVFESSLLRATIDHRLADSRFIFEWFHSPFGNQQIKSIVSFTTVSGVAGSDLARVKVPIPELAVQKELSKRLSMFRKSVTIPNSRLLRSKELTVKFNHSLIGSG